MAVQTYKKGDRTQLSKHFNQREFDCKCTRSTCSVTLIDLDMIDKLEKIRDDLYVQLIVLSGFRCPDHQEDMRKDGRKTADGISTHEIGQAVDWMTGHHTGDQLEAASRKHGFHSVGVAKNWVHCDQRSDHERKWVY